MKKERWDIKWFSQNPVHSMELLVDFTVSVHDIVLYSKGVSNHLIWIKIMEFKIINLVEIKYGKKNADIINLFDISYKDREKCFFFSFTKLIYT